MSRVLADILQTDQLKLSHVISEWDRRSGRSGHDLHLYSDMRVRAIQAIKELGLDPSDTVSGELYFALQEKARIDNMKLQNIVGVGEEDSLQVVFEKINSWITNRTEQKVWVCKPALIRSHLKKCPPKALMKALGLRSMDSMLKRNNPIELVVLARSIESNDWIRKFNTLLKKASPRDFDESNIELLVITDERQKKLEKSGLSSALSVRAYYEAGGIVVTLPGHRFPLDSLAILVMLAETVADIRRHSSYYRALSVRADFGLQIYESAQKGIAQASQQVSEIGWNSIHRHLVGNDYFLSKIEQPYLTKDDLTAASSIDLLMLADQDFAYWKNLDYVFYHHKAHRPVSLNLVDVVLNSVNRNTQQQAVHHHGQSRLWEELWARYLTDEPVAEEVISQFTDN